MANPVQEESQEKEEKQSVASQNSEAGNTEADATKSAKKTKRSKRDTNQIYFRGIVRSITQELDEENRVTNAIVITTPATVIPPDYKSSGLVKVFWGDNERARNKLAGIEVGDHVEVRAQLRTYRTLDTSGGFFYGVSAEKSSPGGLSGLGEYEADRNESVFIGNLKSIYKVNNFFTLFNMIVRVKYEGREIIAHPTFNIGGPLAEAYSRNKDKFAVGKRMGAVCQIRQRQDKRSGKELNEWKCFALMYEDENGEMKALPVPVRPQRNPNHRRRTHGVARAAVEGDLRHAGKKDSGVSEESIQAEESKPAESVDEVLEAIE